MPPRISQLLLILALVFASLPALAQENPPLTAAQILRQARYTAALQQGQLEGTLERKGQKTPFTLSMANAQLAFSFRNPDESLILDLADNAFRFYRVEKGKKASLPTAMHAQSVRGTDLTYEDLALHFLFWSSARILKEEKFHNRKAWNIRINNPKNRGQYAVVYVWIDQESAALMKVQGYNWKGKCIKQFEVTDVMKVGEAWMLQAMRVETMDGKTDKVLGRTYLRFKKPKKKPAQRRAPAWE